MREFGEMVVQALGVKLLNPLCNALLQRLSPLDQCRVVCRLVGERMLECVLDIAGCGLLVYELGQLEFASICSSSSCGPATTLPTSPSRKFLPMTATVSSRSFCSAGSRTMRAARMICTVTGILSWLSGRVILMAPNRAPVRPLRLVP